MIVIIVLATNLFHLIVTRTHVNNEFLKVVGHGTA
jgi:hypothetical protein